MIPLAVAHTYKVLVLGTHACCKPALSIRLTFLLYSNIPNSCIPVAIKAGSLQGFYISLELPAVIPERLQGSSWGALGAEPVAQPHLSHSHAGPTVLGSTAEHWHISDGEERNNTAVLQRCDGKQAAPVWVRGSEQAPRSPSQTYLWHLTAPRQQL